MAETVASGNEFLDLLPIVTLDHLRVEAPESSPPNSNPPAGAAHIGPDAEAAAKGAI